MREEIIQTIVNAESTKLLWLITEIVQTIILVMSAIMFLWYYAPYDILVKIVVTVVAVIIGFDIVKTFVTVRTIMIKVK